MGCWLCVSQSGPTSPARDAASLVRLCRSGTDTRVSVSLSCCAQPAPEPPLPLMLPSLPPPPRGAQAGARGVATPRDAHGKPCVLPEYDFLAAMRASGDRDLRGVAIGVDGWGTGG